MIVKEIKKIGIVGGGRWSREIVKTLDNFLDLDVIFFIYSIHNHKVINKWLKNFKSRKLTLMKRNYVTNEDKIDALIIANSAKDHYETCLNGNLLKIDILVEKPVSTKLSEVELLSYQSKSTQPLLRASNIFLFNKYLDNFQSVIKKNCKKINSVKLIWTDKKNEIKDGIVKAYDPTVPVYIDCMHHVCTILSKFISLKKITINNFIFKKGGSNIEIEMKVNNTDVNITIARNERRRNRKLEINSISDKKFVLNFSKEPGFIKYENKYFVSDEKWNVRERPLQKMLKCFLKEVKYKKSGEKLDFHIALHSAKICNDIEKIYKSKQTSWMKTIKKSNLKKYSEEFLYCVKEFYSIRKNINEKDLERYLDL